MLFRLSCSENNGNGNNNTYIVYKLDRQIMLNDLIFSKRGFDYAKKGGKENHTVLLYANFHHILKIKLVMVFLGIMRLNF